MGHNWIIDVLADLETFARQNGLPSLAGELRKTAFVASAEMAALENGARAGVQMNADEIQPILSGSVEGRSA